MAQDTSAAKRKFLFNRSDFRPLPVKLEHMNIWLNFRDGRVEAAETLRITAREPLQSITLDARDIEIGHVEWLDNAACPSGPVSTRPVLPRGEALRYGHERERSKLVVHLPHAVQSGETFTLGVAATCVPSDNILEGIYKDTTPAGCPQQYVSQCQQWGFQRILPVFDDCTAKCTMITTLEADARYTHLISNGNICRALHPDLKPVCKPGDAARQVITYENFIPMAPYLFIAAVGTWDMLADEAVYPSGRGVRLEYLVPPGRTRGAELPMRILKDSVLWQGRTQDYEYQRDVYRTISMEKSNFGGMENVGNTTIITDAALVDEWTGDARLEYAHGVIVHEFEHNQCGSDVTMETPFDMWLNEAFTVDVDRQFSSTKFDPVCTRLASVDAMRGPVSGPLVIEDAGHMGNIVREGFNDPDELVDGVTYVKAAEVIRMLRLLLGAAVFRQAKNLYFQRYSGGNANTDQFFACFEEVSRRDLSQFKRQWLYTIGYPRITAAYDYDETAQRLRITFKQTRQGRGGLFHVPLALAAVDEQGRDIPGTALTVEIKKRSEELTFSDVPKPAFLSLNRDCSFYGTFRDRSATRAGLIRQVRLDPNRFGRVEAMRQLTDRERIKLIRNPQARISRDWRETFLEIVRDRTLPPGLKSYLLRIEEQSLDRKYLPCYRERYAARARLMAEIATRHFDALRDEFDAVSTYTRSADPCEGLEERRLKAALLRIIVEAGTPAAAALAEDHFRRAWHISDRLSALSCLNLTDHPQRRQIVQEAFELWKDHLSAYAGYLTTIGSGVPDDVFDMFAAEERRACFRVQHPTHSRPLYLPMASNNKMLWTDRGIAWVADTVIRLAPINENTVIRLVSCFQLVNKLADDLRPRVAAALETMARGVDAAKCPSVAGRIKAYLEGCG